VIGMADRGDVPAHGKDRKSDSPPAGSVLVPLRDLTLAGARFVAAIGHRFVADRCLLHASALAYTTLLSLVPLLALMFAVLKGLGVQRRLEPILLSGLGLDAEVVERLVGFIDQTNVGTLGVLGAFALVFTVLSVLGAVEASLNQIWRVAESRSWLRKATDYLSVVLLTPFLLLAGVAITSSVEEQAILRWVLDTEYVGDALVRVMRLAPVAINAIALGVVYAVMPNRRPRLLPIVAGAMFAGVVWQLVQVAYVSLQIGMARYSAIYGALSQLPVTLVWLYVSWVVVLLGAEVGATLELGGESERDGRVSRRAVALHVLVRLAERFREGGGGVAARALAADLAVSPGLTEEVCRGLAKAGYLIAVEAGEPTYALGREPRAIELVVVDAQVGTGALPARLDGRVRAALEALRQRQADPWEGRHLSDLL
jgi:membrane protein